MGFWAKLFGANKSAVMSQSEAASSVSGAGKAKGTMTRSKEQPGVSRIENGSPVMAHGRLDDVEKGGITPGIGGATSGGGSERGGWGPFGSYSRTMNSDMAWAAAFDQNARLSNPIKCLSTDVAKVPLVLKRRIKGADPKKDPVIKSHPFLDLWDNPHPKMTQFQWRTVVLEFLKLVGKCPVRFRDRKPMINRGKKISPPTMLEIVPPHWIAAYPTASEQFWVVQMWNQNPTEVPLADMMYLFEPSLLDLYAPGVGLAKAVDENINIDQAMSAFNSYYFRNMAFLGAILNIPGCDPEVEAANFRQEKEGILNAFKTYITNSGGNVEVTNLSPNMKDLSFSDGVKDNRDLINQRFCQSGVRQGNFGDNASRADLEAADYHQQHNAVVPELIYLGQAITKFLLPEWGEDDLYAEFQNPVKETAERLLNETETLTRAGLMLMNEGRIRHGLEEVQGANCFLIPTNNVLMVPADKIEEYIDLIRQIAVAKLTNPNNQNEQQNSPEESPKPPANGSNGKAKSAEPADVEFRLEKVKEWLAQPNGVKN